MMNLPQAEPCASSLIKYTEEGTFLKSLLFNYIFINLFFINLIKN